MTDYSTEAAAVANAMAAVYENKQTNKKTDITGDFSSDNESYPTVKAVKAIMPQPGTSAPGADTANGTAGSASTFAKSDHQHPLSSAYATSTHTHTASEVTDSTAYSNIGTTANATQAAINSAIDTKLSAISTIDLITLVDSLPTASASTMNKLYLKPEATSASFDTYEIYITVRTGSVGSYSYAWEKVDICRIDLSGYSTTSHTHGNISSDGKVGTASGKPLITTTGGAVSAGAFGTSSGQFAAGHHTHSGYTSTADVASEIGSFATALASAINPS